MLALRFAFWDTWPPNTGGQTAPPVAAEMGTHYRGPNIRSGALMGAIYVLASLGIRIIHLAVRWS